MTSTLFSSCVDLRTTLCNDRWLDDLWLISSDVYLLLETTRRKVIYFFEAAAFFFAFFVFALVFFFFSSSSSPSSEASAFVGLFFAGSFFFSTTFSLSIWALLMSFFVLLSLSADGNLSTPSWSWKTYYVRRLLAVFRTIWLKFLWPSRDDRPSLA